MDDQQQHKRPRLSKRQRVLASDDEEYDPDRSSTPSPSSPHLKQSKATSPGSARKSDNQSDAPLKRRFGPIPKKNRPSAPSQSTSSIKLTTPQPSSSSLASQISRSTPNGTSRKLHNSSTDVDLRDASVYKDLFRMTKSSTARPGNTTARPSISLNAHREKDANRRAELAKLRDEDRERRMRVPTTASILYEQHAQMSRFEMQLRARNSAAALVGPNVLGAAFRNWGSTKASQ